MTLERSGDLQRMPVRISGECDTRVATIDPPRPIPHDKFFLTVRLAADHPFRVASVIATDTWLSWQLGSEAPATVTDQRVNFMPYPRTASAACARPAGPAERDRGGSRDGHRPSLCASAHVPQIATVPTTPRPTRTIMHARRPDGRQTLRRWRDLDCVGGPGETYPSLLRPRENLLS